MIQGDCWTVTIIHYAMGKKKYLGTAQHMPESFCTSASTRRGSTPNWFASSPYSTFAGTREGPSDVTRTL